MGGERRKRTRRNVLVHASRTVNRDERMPSANLLRRLKDATARVHRRVEERVNVFSAGFDLPRYIGLLRHFYGFWEPIEANLKRLPELRNPALALDERLKAYLLEMDLRRFHVDPTLVDRCPQLPQLHTSSQGLGCMYVLEGSTLGSKFIARRLAEHLSITAAQARRFLVLVFVLDAAWQWGYA